LPKAPTSDLEQAGSGERESIPASLPLSSFPGYADATPLPNGPASQAGIEGVQALSMLVGGVAHDLNNLLQVITATAQLLKIRAGNEESRSLLSEIIQATERAADLAHDLRDASRRARALAEKRQG
jgi:signal transduction histidine kinase